MPRQTTGAHTLRARIKERKSPFWRVSTALISLRASAHLMFFRLKRTAIQKPRAKTRKQSKLAGFFKLQ